MLYYGFNGYEGFKEIFGMQEHGNGVKSRRNKILLAFLESREFVHAMRNDPAINKKDKERIMNYFYHLDSMASLQHFVIYAMSKFSMVYMGDAMRSCFHTDSLEFGLRSNVYQIIDGGLCYDGDANAIRYRNLETDRVYKMRAGKLLRKFIEENPFGKMLPEQVKVWICEDFSERWQAYAIGKISTGDLHIGDELEDFERIYSYYHCADGFGSCMQNGSGSHASFYHDAVKAKAAWIENEEEKVIARCIVFTDVTDQDGKKWRLAERQYARDGENALKRLLVDKLIAAGEIDGYKQVGVDCHNARAYVANDGTSLTDREFSIECNLDAGDTLSYQDTFKWYDMDEHTAYNYKSAPHDYELDSTDDVFLEDECRRWSEYHDEYIPEDDAVYVESREDYFYYNEVHYCGNIGENAFEEDCVQLTNGDYAYYGRDCRGYDGVEYCEECEEYFLTDDGEYSEITEQYYCSSQCRENAEERYMEKHPDEYDYDGITDTWYPIETEEMVETLVWDSESKTRYKANIPACGLDAYERYTTVYNDEVYLFNLTSTPRGRMPREIYEQTLDAAAA